MTGRKIRLADINSFCCCNRLQFLSEPVTDLSHMSTVPITAYACAKDCLWQIIADIQPELAPHLFSDMFRSTVMQPGNAPYFKATISRSAPFASCGVQMSG